MRGRRPASQETCRQSWSHAKRIGRGVLVGVGARMPRGDRAPASFAVTCHRRRPRSHVARLSVRSALCAPFSLAVLRPPSCPSRLRGPPRRRRADAEARRSARSRSTAETAAPAGDGPGPAASAGYVGGVTGIGGGLRTVDAASAGVISGAAAQQPADHPARRGAGERARPHRHPAFRGGEGQPVLPARVQPRPRHRHRHRRSTACR